MLQYKILSITEPETDKFTIQVYVYNRNLTISFIRTEITLVDDKFSFVYTPLFFDDSTKKFLKDSPDLLQLADEIIKIVNTDLLSNNVNQKNNLLINIGKTMVYILSLISICYCIYVYYPFITKLL